MLALARSLPARSRRGCRGSIGRLAVGRVGVAVVAVVSLVASLWSLPASADEHEGEDGSARDRQALVALYEAAGGDEWSDAGGWLSDAPLDRWYGVTVDDDERVTRLSLASNGLVGELPAEIGDLERLEYLDLGHNDLVGELPAELGNLASLVELDHSKQPFGAQHSPRVRRALPADCARPQIQRPVGSDPRRARPTW